MMTQVGLQNDRWLQSTLETVSQPIPTIPN